MKFSGETWSRGSVNLSRTALELFPFLGLFDTDSERCPAFCFPEYKGHHPLLLPHLWGITVDHREVKTYFKAHTQDRWPWCLALVVFIFNKFLSSLQSLLDFWLMTENCNIKFKPKIIGISSYSCPLHPHHSAYLLSHIITCPKEKPLWPGSRNYLWSIISGKVGTQFQ